MSVEHFQALPKGVRLNQYEMIGILGAGGFGITYMARDTTLDTMVAIKEYLPGDFAVRQGDSQVTAKSSTSKGDFDWGLSHFLDEARVLAKFRHPHIVHVNQIFQANNTAYIVMEYAKGESLDELLKRVGRLTEQQTKDILFPILDGLKRVHALGFLHRDIKPANIIIREEGGAVLIDFGAAREATETKSRAITAIVTEGYAPLEQYDTRGNQGAWSDIYALGGVAYKCLTGEKPPAATSRLRNDPLAPLEVAAQGRVSKEFATAIDAALRVFENQRPQSVEEFVALISGAQPAANAADAAAAADEATRVLTSGAPQPAQPAPSRIVTPAPTPVPTAPPAAASPLTAAPAPRSATPMRRAYAGVAVAAIVVVAAGGWFTLHGASVPPPAVRQANKAAAVAAKQPPAPETPVPATPVTSPVEPPATANITAGLSGPALAPPAITRPADASPTQPKSAPAPQREASLERPVQPPAPAAPPPLQTSFDCAKANNDAEHLVCTDRDLAALDVRMASLYQQGLNSVADANAFYGEQADWLSRRDACTDKQCLVVSYNTRIKDLQRWLPH